MARSADAVRPRRSDPGRPRRSHARRPRARAHRRGTVMDRPTPALRREPGPDAGAVGDDLELVARIRDEIRERGRITFARFMERALYEPGHGYYRRSDPGPGR